MREKLIVVGDKFHGLFIPWTFVDDFFVIRNP